MSSAMPVFTKQNLCAQRGMNVTGYSVCEVSGRQSWSPNTHPTVCCKHSRSTAVCCVPLL